MKCLRFIRWSVTIGLVAAMIASACLRFWGVMTINVLGMTITWIWLFDLLVLVNKFWF